MATVSDTTQKFTADKIADQKAAAKASKAQGTNPNAELDKDAFMKLLLTELQYQDPTSPMDTEKMLTQTSQLATLEMQENTNSTMKELVSQLKSNSSMYALSALGKFAKLGNESVSVKEGDHSVNIPIFLPEDAKSGVMRILDSTNKEVATINLGEAAAGIATYKWDLSLNDGKTAKPGGYQVRVDYKNKDDKVGSATYGNYPVESVKFVDGKAKIKLAGEYVSLEDVAEFY
ncbi:flagellar basal body rod modification protein [Campylobacter mucosalis]|uniref:flagellar basal body rod modification protein n=1 Tax=Campylobacter mucosalis TaxID=202 RepID=UPI00146FE47C|nr:flagellar basal body rod modification protein [Campylobacter mucosalis]